MTKKSMSRSETNEPNGLVCKVAEKYAIDPGGLLETLKATAFKQSKDNAVITDEQMYALLIVSNQYNLNPFTREIYAFPDKKGGIVPVVGVDGWNRIANEHTQFNGVEFVYSKDIIQMEGALAHCHAWIEAVLYRKDRSNPIRVREYLDECYRPPFKDWDTGYVSNGPWQTHPKRFLRHKALIQCYRVGFSFVGIYDEDEAYRIIEAQADDGSKPATIIPFRKVEPQIVGDQVLPTEAELPEVDFNRVEVDEFVKKLVMRADASNQWQAAKDLIDERLKGQAAVYAKEELTKAEESTKAEEGTDSTVTAKEPPQVQVDLKMESDEADAEKSIDTIQMALPGYSGDTFY